MNQYINYKCSLINATTKEALWRSWEVGANSPELALARFRSDMETYYMQAANTGVPDDYPANYYYQAEPLPYKWFDCELWKQGTFDESVYVYAANEAHAHELVVMSWHYPFRRKYNSGKYEIELKIIEMDPETVTLPVSELPKP